MKRRAFVVAAAGAVALLAACGKTGTDAGAFHAIDITGAQYARDFRLPDPDGRERTLSEFKGKLVAVFFGYAQCPDVCPTSLLELAQARQLLGADGEKLQGIFITVDPERDTPEVLKAYMASFDPGFIALRGTPEQTAEVAKEFKVFYAKVPGKTPDTYTIDHTAGMYVFDTQGRIRLFTRHGAGAQALAEDLRRLLQSAS
ncbi:SCO family protein [Caldimonas thermodepolymerans]|jgi:protein SCO1/2|uniref:Protein SCO1/2 n=1 Tax=Caldimonas thermodepolymerans TaxID=215580 RepID=A0A2S5T3Q6_9BURK|nr:SCO family protein [Caldimonas thermodepolymerans]PPE69586.1 SCO family protein [Caldimonas thermodepolymerans]QPC30899.1 SCO family protein [Caldimonas thermodepolymerans]RDH97095.1 protein SCO1/2 [Caldimonas thermodepolymerans]TCP09003.1 protein SCO1/2 [Caldimonas thermodepolymerans]UZG43638.1 SCO family protein [Caldimonas thermodepolymerans]